MAGNTNTTRAPRAASRRPPVADWRAGLSPADRKDADEILSRYGAAKFGRLATAHSAARRKRGAPSKADERAPLLDKIALLVVADPPCSPWRAAGVVAREHGPATMLVESLQKRLREDFEKDKARLLARARAAKSRAAYAAAAPGRGSPVILPQWARPMRDVQETGWHAHAKRLLEETSLVARAARHLEETSLAAQVRRDLRE